MPPANLSDQQAHQIVAYLRSLAAATDTAGASKADLAHGKSLFESKGCLNCHRVKDHGSRVGPDLTGIGARRKRDEIERSIVDPNAEVLPENRYVQAVTRDGATITGKNPQRRYLLAAAHRQQRKAGIRSESGPEQVRIPEELRRCPPIAIN